MVYGIQSLNCPLYGQDVHEKPLNSYAFSIGPQFGFIYGQAEEIVYPSSQYKAELLSQLLWDMKPVVYDGLLLDFSPVQPLKKWGFYATLSLKSAIPGISGSMEDRDWQSTENTALTNYSIHDNITRELFFADLSAGLSFPLEANLLFKSYISLSYMHMKFSGQYGYGFYAEYLGGGKYAPISEAEKHPWSEWERVINYTQDWLTISPGFSLGYYFLDHFYTELFFQISPWIMCHDIDEHLTTNTEFRDFMNGNLLFEPGFQFLYCINEQLELSLKFSWRHIGGTKGETYWRSPIGKGDYKQEGKAGAGLSLIDTGLCLKIRL